MTSHSIDSQTGLRPRFAWRTTRFEIDLDQPRVMGIVNVTPDSFSDGDPGMTAARAIATCQRLLAEGADILDLGGESSRPGADPVDVDTELARVLPVLREALTLGCPISIDSAKPQVMRAALDLGVDIVNDIGALRAPGAMELVATHGSCGVCLMHMRGTPRSMQAEADYRDVVVEVRDFLADRMQAAEAAGIARGRIALDPGIGFGKMHAHNLELLSRQRELLALDVPWLVGWSRKSTLAHLSGVSSTPPRERTAEQRATLDAASVAASLMAVERGARIVRVHAVAAMKAALSVFQAAPEPRR